MLAAQPSADSNRTSFPTSLSAQAYWLVMKISRCQEVSASEAANSVRETGEAMKRRRSTR